MDKLSKLEEYRKIELAAEVLAYLNIARVRCSYTSFGEFVGVHPKYVSHFLGERRWEASWVVSTTGYEPSRYQAKDIHPKLRQRHEVILEGAALKKCMDDGWGITEDGIEEWRGVLSRALLNYLTVMRRFCTHAAFGEVIGVSASAAGDYVRKWREGKPSSVVRKTKTKRTIELHQGNNHSGPAKQDIIESGIELEALMRLHWQYSALKVWSIRDMPTSPKCSWWHTEDT